MAEYAFRIKQQLNYVNEHSFNNFQLRVGKLFKDSLFIFWRNIQPFSHDAPPPIFGFRIKTKNILMKQK